MFAWVCKFVCAHVRVLHVCKYVYVRILNYVYVMCKYAFHVKYIRTYVDIRTYHMSLHTYCLISHESLM